MMYRLYGIGKVDKVRWREKEAMKMSIGVSWMFELGKV